MGWKNFLQEVFPWINHEKESSQIDYEKLLDSQLAEEWIEKDDSKAYSELCKRYGSLIFGIAARTIGLDLAQDVVQHCFMVIVEKTKKKEEIKDFRKYFLSVGYNYIKSILPKRKVEVSFEEEMERFDVVDELGISDSTIVNSMETISKVLSELPEENQQIMYLKVAGYEISEIADMLGKGKIKVKNIIYKSRKHIKQRLADLSGEQNGK